jgi:hypothetical protein
MLVACSRTTSYSKAALPKTAPSNKATEQEAATCGAKQRFKHQQLQHEAFGSTNPLQAARQERRHHAVCLGARDESPREQNISCEQPLHAAQPPC